MSDTMRDAFEAEAIKRGYPWSDNQSVRQFNAYAWEVWQAAQSRPAPHGVSNIEIVVDPSIQKGEAVLRLDGKEVGRITNIAAPPPPVPADVQEITRLIQPYVAACLKFNYTPMELIEQAEADVNEAFKPIEAAITALVEKNHELQFSLDGVNAMRRPLCEDEIIHGIWAACSPEDGTEMELIEFARAIEKAHGIEPEQGDGGGV